MAAVRMALESILVRLPVGAVAFTLDAYDSERAAQHKWYLHKGNRSVAAKAMIDGKWVKLHRWLVGALPGEEVDHIDRNPYNCCRSNLRRVTRHENERNKGARRGSKTGLRGVHPVKGGFEATLQWHGVRYRLGRFEEAWHARLAYLIKEWSLINAR